MGRLERPAMTGEMTGTTSDDGAAAPRAGGGGGGSSTRAPARREGLGAVHTTLKRAMSELSQLTE